VKSIGVPGKDHIHVTTLNVLQETLVARTDAPAKGRDVVVFVDGDDAPATLPRKRFAVLALSCHPETSTHSVL